MIKWNFEKGAPKFTLFSYFSIRVASLYYRLLRLKGYATGHCHPFFYPLVEAHPGHITNYLRPIMSLSSKLQH